jgi:excisionase family DNA binding protein
MPEVWEGRESRGGSGVKAQVTAVRYMRDGRGSAKMRPTITAQGGDWVAGDGAWLTVGQAAERLRVGLETVRRAIDSGKLTAGRTPGGHRRVSAASVDKLYREMYPEEPPEPDGG